MGLLSRRFECEVEGERFEVSVHRNGVYDVEWLDCPYDEVPGGFSVSSFGGAGFGIPDDNPEGFIELNWKDPRVDEMIIQDIREWLEHNITEDGCCAACIADAQMRSDDLLDREFDVTVDGREWHVKVWQDVWEAWLADGSAGYGSYRNIDPNLTPEERAIDDEAFTDEGIIRHISENYVPARRGLSRFFKP